eukprot:8171712-Prorocentrum_lima.AAC.1
MHELVYPLRLPDLNLVLEVPIKHPHDCVEGLRLLQVFQRYCSSLSKRSPSNDAMRASAPSATVRSPL